VPCELVYPGATDVEHASLPEAVIGLLKPTAASAN